MVGIPIESIQNRDQISSSHKFPRNTALVHPVLNLCPKEEWAFMEIISKINQPTVRIGFVPLNDAAPLLLAQELDLFQKHGLNVKLSRELGWASVRDKVVTGELDGAHSIIGLPLCSMVAGQFSRTLPVIAPLITSLQGNAITIGSKYREAGLQTPKAMFEHLAKSKSSRSLTFAIVSKFSSHLILVRQWLRNGGLNPDTDANIVVLPPPQMVHHLKAGHIDGYCVGEPWNSLSVMIGHGFCAATSVEISPYHPEKILMLSRSFADKEPELSRKLVSAISEACQLCDMSEHRPLLSQVLARNDYLNLSPEILKDSLEGTLLRKNNPALDNNSDFILFSGSGVNSPNSQKKSWIYNGLREAGSLLESGRSIFQSMKEIYRSDYLKETNDSLSSVQSEQPEAPLAI